MQELQHIFNVILQTESEKKKETISSLFEEGKKIVSGRY